MTGTARSDGALVDERLVVCARSGTAAAATVYAILRFGPDAAGRTLAAAALFIALDFARFHQRPGHRGTAIELILMALQFTVLGSVFFGPAPFGFGSEVPFRVMFDGPFYLLVLCLLASNAAAARPAVFLGATAASLALWVAVWRVAMADPATLTRQSLNMARFKSAMDLLRAVNDPHFFNISLWKNAAFNGAVIAAALGLGIYRTRRLARRSAAREAARSALLAYFSPQLADAILNSKGPRLEPETRLMAVLNCDLVGFTSLAETLPPEAVARILKLYRSMAEDAVFAEDGAILAHVGDGLVALFGLTGSDAADRALACALRMAEAWPIAAADLSAEPPPLALGVDQGLTLVGLVGEDRSRSLLALGPAVDGAERLQQATRKAGTPILMSDEAYRALGAARSGAERCEVEGAPAWRLRARELEPASA